MNIILLNGSPRPGGNTAAMIEAFEKGLDQSKHNYRRFDVARMNIHGCIACEYCHEKEKRVCFRKDDMQEIYPVLDEADMIILASPVYYHAMSGQLNTAMNRIYALDKPEYLKKAALFLSSGSDNVYGGALYQYENSFLDYLKLDDLGIFKAYGKQNKSPELLESIEAWARELPDVEHTPRPKEKEEKENQENEEMKTETE